MILRLWLPIEIVDEADDDSESDKGPHDYSYQGSPIQLVFLIIIIALWIIGGGIGTVRAGAVIIAAVLATI